MKKIFLIILILIFIGLGISCEKEEKFIEICTCIKENTDVYTGPGTNFEKDNSKQPIKGIKLYTLETIGDWIRFRLTPELVITHAPGHMFITDIKDDDLASY